MFETLEDRLENKKPLDRGYPILMFSISAIVSSIALILRVMAWLFSPVQPCRLGHRPLAIFDLVGNEPQIVSSDDPSRFPGSQHDSALAPAGTGRPPVSITMVQLSSCSLT